MSFLRLAGRRTYQSASFSSISRRTFTAHTSLRGNGYGDPKGDPAGANPQEQGRNPKVDQEHPGPPAPSAAGGEGGSSSSASKSSSSGQSKSGAKPKISDTPQPDSESADVKKHNDELDQRRAKTHEKSDNEKVDPKFWKGHAGEKEK